MNDINDLNKYKRAKIIVQDLESVLQIINLSIQGLELFREYTSLQETLLCLYDSKTILEVHLENNKQVLKTKGKM